MSPEAVALSLSGPRKAAALLITLGTEASAKLLARLPPEAIDRVALELMRMPAVDSDVRDAILEEAYAGLFAHAGVLPGGENYAVELFGQAFGSGKARELLDRVHQAQQIIPFDFMRDIDPVQAAGLLADEHPQTIAIVLAHLEPRASALILVQFDPLVQVEVAKRIALTEQVSPEAVGVVEEGLRRKLSSVVTEVTSVGGSRPLAHVLNQIGRTNERQILAALAEQDSQLADEVRRYMFVFDDIAVLDDRAMQRVIRELDAKDMALALRPATEELRLKFFQNMSQRAAEMLREEMGLGGQVRLKAVEEAQQRIIDTIKKLEDSDEIAINRGGTEDVLI
jgi:flagellar motor switch protein FliG